MKTWSWMVSVMLFLGVASLQAEHYVVGVENTQYFPHYTSENGEYTGFARDLLDAFAKDKGHTIDYEIVPVRRLFSLFLKGAVDLKYPDNPYWSADAKKDKNVAYSDPVVNYIDGVMVLPKNKGKGKGGIGKLGTVMGFTAFELLDDIKSGAVKINENKSFTALLKQTIAGRVDGAYANVAVANYHLREILKQPGALVFDPEIPHTRDAYRLSTIKHSALIEEFNAWMKENQPNIQAIKDKYAVEAGL